MASFAVHMFSHPFQYYEVCLSNRYGELEWHRHLAVGHILQLPHEVCPPGWSAVVAGFLMCNRARKFILILFVPTVIPHFPDYEPRGDDQLRFPVARLYPIASFHRLSCLPVVRAIAEGNVWLAVMRYLHWLLQKDVGRVNRKMSARRADVLARDVEKVEDPYPPKKTTKRSRSLGAMSTPSKRKRRGPQRYSPTEMTRTPPKPPASDPLPLVTPPPSQPPSVASIMTASGSGSGSGGSGTGGADDDVSIASPPPLPNRKNVARELLQARMKLKKMSTPRK